MKLYLPELKATPVLLGAGFAIYALSVLMPDQSITTALRLVQETHYHYIAELLILIGLLISGVMIDWVISKHKAKVQQKAEHVAALMQSLNFVHSHLNQGLGEMHYVLEQIRQRYPDTVLPIGLLENKVKEAEVQLKIISFLEQMQTNVNSGGPDYLDLEIMEPK